MESLTPFKRLVLWGLYAILCRVSGDVTIGGLLTFIQLEIYKGASAGQIAPNLRDEYIKEQARIGSEMKEE